MPESDRGDLRRVIGFWGGTAVIVGITIGSGIFRKPYTLARDVGDPLVILAFWAGFGLVSLCGALALAELSSLGLMLPSSIAVGLALGYFLDKIFGTWPWLLMTFTVLGIVSGFMSLLRGLKKLGIEKDKENDEND